MQKVGARCAGYSDGDAQWPRCFFSSLFFKTLLLKSFFKTLLLLYSLKSLFLRHTLPYYFFSFTLLLFSIFKTLLLKSSFLFFKVSCVRLALSHVPFNLS
jgi:hypothetical protein